MVSSAVERFVYTEDVGGSKPSPPTFDINFLKLEPKVSAIFILTDMNMSPKDFLYKLFQLFFTIIFEDTSDKFRLTVSVGLTIN